MPRPETVAAHAHRNRSTTRLTLPAFGDTRPCSSLAVIQRLSLVRNNDDEVVMSHLDTILVRRRVPLD